MRPQNVLDVILAWLLLIVLAALIVRQKGGSDVGRPRGGRIAIWFLLWVVAGFLMSFSLATGLSIGLLILPLGAVLLLWVAGRAPRYREASGFLVGIGVTAMLIASLNA